MYHSVRTCDDPPGEYVIDDNSALDDWLKSRELEYKKNKLELDRSLKKGSPSRSGGSTMKFDANDME